MVKVAICMPFYKENPSKTTYSIIKTIMYFNKIGVKLEFFAADNTYIHDARNECLQKFLQSHEQGEFDWCVWIDSDQVFTPQDILDLLQSATASKLNILSGVYFTRAYNLCLPVILNKNEGNEKLTKGNYHYLTTLPENMLFEADAVGFGFLTIKPSVLKDLKAKFGEYVFDYRRTEAGQHLGEDMVFCERARELGYKITVDKSIIVGHMGGEIGLREYKAFLAERFLEEQHDSQK